MANFLRSLAAGIALAALTPAAAHGAARSGPLVYVNDGSQLVALPPTPFATPKVIAEGVSHNSAPDVSPDGRSVLYVTAAGTQVARLPVAGGTPDDVATPPADR